MKLKPSEKRRERAEMYRTLAQELKHHIDNGSEWLWADKNGEELPVQIAQFRREVLENVIRGLRTRARNLEGEP